MSGQFKLKLPLVVGASVLAAFLFAWFLYGAGWFVYGLVNQALTIYPAPETQSAFLKDYSPEQVTKRFVCPRYSSNFQNGRSAGAGRHFVTNEGTFQQHLIIKSADWMPLINSLQADISSQLTSQHAQLLDTSGDARDGFKLQYTTDHSLGTVELRPKVINPEDVIGHLTSGLPNRICAGEAAIEVRVVVHEQYFKTTPSLTNIRMAVSQK